MTQSQKFWQKPLFFLVLAWSLLCLMRLALYAFQGLDADVAWALTIQKKWLSGEIPYQDFIEVNPPGVLLLYEPVSWLTKISGLSIVHSFFIVMDCLILCTVLIMYTLLKDYSVRRQSRNDIAIVPFRLKFLVFIMLLEQIGSGFMYGQREHIAIIMVMPFLLLQSLRLADIQQKPAFIALCGIFCGMALCIKPNFSLYIIGIIAILIWRFGFKYLFSCLEIYFTALIVLLYIMICFVNFPLFFSVVFDFLVYIYIPLRQPWPDLLFGAAPPIFLVFGLFIGAHLFLNRHDLWQSLRKTRNNESTKLNYKIAPLDKTKQINLLFTLTTFLAACGGLLDYFIQGKAFGYHALPCMTFSALSFASLEPLWALSLRSLFQIKNIVSISILIIFNLPLITTHASTSALKAAILRANTKSFAPLTMIPLCTYDVIVSRLALETGGQFVSATAANHLTMLSQFRLTSVLDPKIKSMIADYTKLDHDLARDDILIKKPKIIITHVKDFYLDPNTPQEKQLEACINKFWANDHEIKKTLEDYTFFEAVDDYGVYVRRE